MPRVLRAVVLSLLLAAPLAAQRPQAPEFASAFVPQGHWSLDAARRVVALGLAPRDFGWGDAPVTRRAMALLLACAADSARRAGLAVAPQLEGEWARFREETPSVGSAVEEARAPRRLAGDASMLLGLHGRSGMLGTGYANWRQYGGGPPVPLDNSFGPAIGAEWAASLARYVALDAAPARRAGSWRHSEAYALLLWKRGGLWGGRRAIAYGPGESGGLIFNPSTAMNGLGLYTEPMALPGALRALGFGRFEANLFRIDSSNAIERPWILAMHASWSPFARLELGGTWGAIFSGSGQPPFTWRNFWTMLHHHRAVYVTGGREFENQLVSAEIRFRSPTPFPLLTYLEWGSEDNHSAWRDVPGIVAGAELPSLPGAPSVSAGAEYAFFHEPCFDCSSGGIGSNWYRHYIYTAGWAVDPVPLGHPLGGDGRQWTAYARHVSPDARLRVKGSAFWRDRGYYNLFAPDREGTSVGATLRVERRLGASVDAIADGALEVGQRRWRQATLLLGARRSF